MASNCNRLYLQVYELVEFNKPKSSVLPFHLQTCSRRRFIFSVCKSIAEYVHIIIQRKRKLCILMLLQEKIFWAINKMLLDFMQTGLLIRDNLFPCQSRWDPLPSLWRRRHFLTRVPNSASSTIYWSIFQDNSQLSQSEFRSLLVRYIDLHRTDLNA